MYSVFKLLDINYFISNLLETLTLGGMRLKNKNDFKINEKGCMNLCLMIFK